MERAIDSDDATEARRETEEVLLAASKERAEHLIALQKKSSLASRLNLRAARELRDASDEKRLQPLFIQRFFERAWTACGGTIRKDEHFPVWHLGPTPVALLDLARVQRISIKDRYDTPFVFDKQLVSVASKIKIPDRTKLLGPGHVLFEALIKWAIRESRQAFGLWVFSGPCWMEGVLCSLRNPSYRFIPRLSASSPRCLREYSVVLDGR
jgi:hypothetical protein